jgi:hypothetical protein
MSQADTARKPELKPPNGVWFLGVMSRTLFLMILATVTARVAHPQIETLRSVIETPGDAIRVALGFMVCCWIIINIFRLPKDADAYRSWAYLGLGLIPLGLLCAYVVW